MPEQQIVEIAKAIGANLKVLILDEPTASLTAREVDRLFGVVASLRDRGTSVSSTSRTAWRRSRPSPDG